MTSVIRPRSWDGRVYLSLVCPQQVCVWGGGGLFIPYANWATCEPQLDFISVTVFLVWSVTSVTVALLA